VIKKEGEALEFLKEAKEEGGGKKMLKKGKVSERARLRANKSGASKTAAEEEEEKPTETLEKKKRKEPTGTPFNGRRA